MKNLKRIRYYTMNSWNLTMAPAYNLKVHTVIDSDLQNKVYELMDTEYFYDDINMMIEDFAIEFDYKWQAGFNGRSGVLQRELMNYEIGLSWEGINDLNFRDGIKGYDFTEEEIKYEYNKHMEENEY